jgi:hypothetical protein
VSDQLQDIGKVPSRNFDWLPFTPPPPSHLLWSFSRPIRRGEAARKVSHHAHDFEKSAWPLFFGRVIPTSQRHGATLRVAYKSAKELPSLASFSSHTPLTLLKVCIFDQKHRDKDRQARLHPGARGLPGLG